MKKTIVAFFAACSAIFAAPASSDAFHFIRFNAGLPIAFPIDDTINGGDAFSGKNFGVDIAAFDNLTVGYDALALGGGGAYVHKGLRIGYKLTPQIGAAFDLGNTGGNSSITVGIFSDIIGGRTKAGILHGLALRADYYVPDTDDFGVGAIVLSVGASFGY
ncbi:MAG: hypothetical protein LBF86_06010 [Helicobacteraceae bacterium]|jgi:hypothetical protein|nr:hypothetical protein [Helicobacteraceae bacterium]